MFTTQRSESRKENHVDYKSSSVDIRCSTHYFMEKQAQVVYTIAKFKEFQDELTAKLSAIVPSLSLEKYYADMPFMS
ncbi:unnamed protein product [Prunus armeniaca]|uniref:Uncharacterized protein n=1 Tax=Prunus armeniaca TaxID=36596 RepID=A0A6J5TZG3_PRUAR|nr:unnamed protein product [Prunus armeniaca]